MAARKRIQQKIRSQRGASLTWGLLMFLVCAVIGSVVLTAGTAAAGRLKNMAETEQRYYAVNSAAELLAQRLTERAVTVKQEKVSYTIIGDMYYIETESSPRFDESGEQVMDENGEPVMDPPPPPQYLGEFELPKDEQPQPDWSEPTLDVSLPGEVSGGEPGNFDELLKVLAQMILYGKNYSSLNKQQKWEYRGDAEHAEETISFTDEEWTISLAGSEIDTAKKNEMLVDIKPELSIKRMDETSQEYEVVLELLIGNHVEKDAHSGTVKENNRYTLKMVLTLSNGILDQEYTEREDYPGDFPGVLPDPNPLQEGKYVTYYSVKEKSVSTRTSEIKWDLQDLTVEGKMSNESNP